MDKKIAGLLGAAAALTTMASAQAAPTPTTGPSPAASYRDLLEPIANPLPALQADNARLTKERAEGTEVAQVSIQLGHHHHHHHVRFYHHHHHHHHHRFRFYHHHHHHHHHHGY